MTGQMYSSEEYAISAFRSKFLFNKIIVCNVKNPTEKDFDSIRELYKVFWMAHYYMWDKFGHIQFKPLQTSFSLSAILGNSSFLSFKVHLNTDSDWIVETNAPSLQLASVCDLMTQKSQEMAERYKNIHGSNLTDLLGSKLAGTSNRHMPLSHSSLLGDWIAVEIEGEYNPIPTKAFIENELLTPSYTLKFYGNSCCSFGGENPNSIKASGLYDSNYNIVLSNDRVLAFVVSLDGNELKVVHRYRNNYSGNLIARSDNDLLVITYRRVSDLRESIKY